MSELSVAVVPMLYDPSAPLARSSLEPSAKELQAYADAVRAWRVAGAGLALSRVHLVKLRTHGDAETRGEHVPTIQDLLPVRIEIPVHQHIRTRPLSMSEREVLSALVLANTLSLDADEIASMSSRLFVGAADPFPVRWSDAWAINTLRSYDDSSFGGFT